MKLLDSNVILYLVNNKLADPLPVDGFFASVTTKIEVLGFRNLVSAEEQALHALFQDVTVIGLDTNIVQKTIELRRMTTLRLPDAIIAATAIIANLDPLSLDVGFSKVEGLRLSTPKLLA